MLLGAKTLTVQRRPGSWVNGVWTLDSPAPATFTVSASIQPLDPNTVQMLPEAARTRARYNAYALYQQTEIKSTDLSDEQAADLVTFDGDDYVCYSAANWTSHLCAIAHRAYVLLAVGGDE